MSDVAKTPREELECKKKYLYEHSMFWECNDGSKCQILEDDVCILLNEQQATIEQLQEENKELVKNFDDLVEWASEIAKRNVVLGEENASLKQRIRDIKYNNCD